MSEELDELYRLQTGDIPRAAATLADAFQHDPVWNAVFNNATMAQRAYAFETPLRYCQKYGGVYATSEDMEGVAAWLPSAVAEMTFCRVLRSGALWPVSMFGFQLARKMRPIFTPIELDRKAYIGGNPYIYLQIIGVASAFQGQGFGARLLRALIAESEQSGVSLYLETETVANVAMYERLGFTVIKKVVLPVIDLPMWEMARQHEN